MNLLVSQYTPFYLAVLVVGLGVIYSNSRIGDIKDLLRAELGRLEATLRTDIAKVDQGIAHLDERIGRLEIRMDKLELRMDHLESRMDRLETRMDGLEIRMDRFERGLIVRP